MNSLQYTELKAVKSKDPRHPLTFTFYDSSLQNGDFNAL